MNNHKNDLSKILDINKKINSYSNLKDILDNILLSARELFNCAGGSLLLVDENNEYLKFEVVHGEGKEKLEGLKIPASKGIAGYIFSTQTPVISNNVEKDPRFFNAVDKITGMKTQKILGVPLVKDNKCIGVIEVINKKDNNDFTRSDLELLSILAEQSVIAITNATLLKKIQDRAKQLEYLHEISNFTISSIENSKEFFDKIVNFVSQLTNSKRVSIMILDEKTKELKIVSSIGIDKDIVGKIKVNIQDTNKPSVKAFLEGKEIVVSNVDKDPTFGPNKKLRYKTNSFMIFPIKTHSSTFGVLNITEIENTKLIEKEDIEFLQVLANQVGYGYESIRSYERKLEEKAFNMEIEIMTKIQTEMLPRNFNLSNKLDIYFFLKPYKMVGGDFFDVYNLSDNKICFFLGDVSGKGLHASLFMAAVKSTIKAISFEFRETKKILEISNSVLTQSSETGMFSTLFLGIINLEDNTLVFSNAGHGQQFILREDQIIYLHTKGIPLGIYPNTEYHQNKIELKKNDIIVMYSDGITESVNEKEEMFGEKRIIEIVKESINLPSEEITKRVIKKLMLFKTENPNYDDDISLGIIKIL